jgi:hypothetical protein
MLNCSKFKQIAWAAPGEDDTNPSVNKNSPPAGYWADAKKHLTRSKETDMKNRSILTFVVLGLLISVPPVLWCSETEAASMITHASSVIMAPSPSHDAIKAALLEILDASLLILPKTDYSDEYRSRIEVAKTQFSEQSLFSDKGHQYLSLAYRLVTAGKRWQFPEELTVPYRERDIMEQAKKLAQKLIDSALSELKAGRNEQSVRYLLELVLMVVTPIQH